MDTIGNPLLWGAFAALVVVALLVDLVLMRHGGPHRVTFKEALFWSIGWIGLAIWMYQLRHRLLALAHQQPHANDA